MSCLGFLEDLPRAEGSEGFEVHMRPNVADECSIKAARCCKASTRKGRQKEFKKQLESVHSELSNKSAGIFCRIPLAPVCCTGQSGVYAA